MRGEGAEGKRESVSLRSSGGWMSRGEPRRNGRRMEGRVEEEEADS